MSGQTIRLLEQIRDNMKELKLSKVSIDNQEHSESKSEFSLTNGVPKKDESGKMVWNENDLRNAKSVKESMDAVNGFCGLMAGFQGFIINEYVRMEKTPREYEELSSIFKWGLFLLITSFVLNIGAAIASFLWGVFLREGHYRLWFMKVVGRLVKLMATIAVLSFCVGVLLFIETIGLDNEMLIPIYICSGLFFTIIMSVFLYTMIIVAMIDTSDMYTDVMDSVNG
tara:strand:+ start:1211 stop:1888 length:678 start_codon:yes stop_codon:yes gene_type:complete